MLSRSYFNLSNFEDYSGIGDRTRIPKVISVPGIISDFESGSGVESPESYPFSPVSKKRRIIVANQLPLKCYKDSSHGEKWCFDWDKEAVSLQFRDGFSSDVEVVYVGCLAVEIDLSEQEEVSQLLFDEFKCVPTFLSSDLVNKFYHGFCEHYLRPLFHYMLPLSPNHGVGFDKARWPAYVSANKIFADKVMEVINPDEDYVWVHDYHLMVFPTFLRKRYRRVKLGFSFTFLFLHLKCIELYLSERRFEGSFEL